MRIIVAPWFALAACGGALFEHPTPTSDPRAVDAARLAGEVSAGLEAVAIGASLLVDLPALPRDPTGLVGPVLGVFTDLFDSCVQVTDDGAGVAVTLGEGGCGLPGTELRLAGSLRLELLQGGYGVAFAGLDVAGVALAGQLRIAVTGERRIRIDGAIEVGDLALSIRGEVSTDRTHTAVTFTGDGELRAGGEAWRFRARGLDRHLVADCYPKSGVLELYGRANIAIRFDDAQLGLDSDDSGLVRLAADGAAEQVVRLPARACVGL